MLPSLRLVAFYVNRVADLASRAVRPCSRVSGKQQVDACRACMNICGVIISEVAPGHGLVFFR